MDGYALISIDTTGEKAFVKLVDSHDERLREYFGSYRSDLNLEDHFLGQLPDGLNDTLLMVFFTYRSVACGGWEDVNSEYEDVFNLEQYVIMERNYKEFWREQISYILTSGGIVEYPNSNLYSIEDVNFINEFADEVIEDWELFYEENFTVCDRYQKNKIQ